MLLYPLLHLKAEYLFTTVIVDSPNISTTIGVGVPDAKTNERCIYTYSIDTVLYTNLQLYAAELSFTCTVVPIINHARLHHVYFVLYNRIVYTLV